MLSVLHEWDKFVACPTEIHSKENIQTVIIWLLATVRSNGGGRGQ
jgi:hypothetical protein